MRNTLLFLLLASAALPAFAADDADDRSARREAARAQRAEARSERQADRPRQSQGSERPAEARSVEPQVNRDRAVVLERSRVVVGQRPIDRRSDRGHAARPIVEQQLGPSDSVRDWRRQERARLQAGDRPEIELRDGKLREVRQERREQRPGSSDAIGSRRPPVISPVPREGTQPPPPAAARPSSLSTSHWRGDWRSDHRYDWRSHRRRHRSLFHFGFYFDPFGWSYRPYSVGWRLWPSYYRSSYWLNDPWMYRLPPAYPPYRWVRYHEDALLVDTWSGEVVDVIYNFFW